MRRIFRLIAILTLSILILGSSAVPPGEQTERVRASTRDIEFDYIAWTLNALGIKLQQAALGTVNYLPENQREQLMQDYLEMVSSIQHSEAQLNSLFSDPNIKDPQAASVGLRTELQALYGQRAHLGPLAESVLQDQISKITAESGLSIFGQPVPPVMYHVTPLPLALIVSPRSVIRQDENISLIPDLTIDQQAALEGQVDRELDISSLVVGIGGVGVYPTMVMQTSDLNWLSEVVAHEWAHNFLTLRPLGVSYLTSPELRTMNETAASITGKEIGRTLIEKYYPELLPPAPIEAGPPSKGSSQPNEPPPFDFRAEMHTTRLTVDQLLAEGKIEAAEQYMEQRRSFFWDNGYRIRKLNQAYFAFYGAYADEPGGAAGEDPVGKAVRTLRVQSPSLATFLNKISWMSSFEQLERAIADPT